MFLICIFTQMLRNCSLFYIKSQIRKVKQKVQMQKSDAHILFDFYFIKRAPKVLNVLSYQLNFNCLYAVIFHNLTPTRTLGAMLGFNVFPENPPTSEEAGDWTTDLKVSTSHPLFFVKQVKMNSNKQQTVSELLPSSEGKIFSPPTSSCFEQRHKNIQWLCFCWVRAEKIAHNPWHYLKATLCSYGVVVWRGLLWCHCV